MARKFVVSLDLNKNEILNARIQNLSSAPSSPVAGQIYYDTSTNVMYFYNGSAWIPTSGSTEVIQDVIGSAVLGGTALTATYNDGAGTTTIDLDNTTVSSGSYGSTTKIPTFTVDAQGRLTAAGEEDVATTLTITSDTSGNTTVDLLSENIHFDGGDGITTDFAVSPNKGISIAVDSTVTRNGATQTLTNKTISDSLSFNDGTGNTSTINANGSHLEIDANDDLLLTTGSGDIILNADGQSYIGSATTGNRIATQSYAETQAGNAQTAAETYADNAVQTHSGSSGGVHGISGNVVGTSDTQTLSNKTLDTASLGSDLNASSKKITNLADPTSPTDAANKRYVDSAVAGLDWKSAVNLLSTSNIADLTDVTLTIDGHAVGTSEIGYRVLLTAQSTDSQNGIYEVIAGTTGTITLQRSADADAYGELVGASVFVMEGTTYANTSWVQSNHYLTDFTNQDWVQFSGAGTYIAGAGLTQDGLTFNVGAGTGITVNSNDVAIDTTVVARKHTATIGDGSATTYTVTHNLSTRYVTVQVFDSSTYETVEADVVRNGDNTVQVSFASAPSSNAYKVIVVG